MSERCQQRHQRPSCSERQQRCISTQLNLIANQLPEVNQDFLNLARSQLEAFNKLQRSNQSAQPSQSYRSRSPPPSRPHPPSQRTVPAPPLLLILTPLHAPDPLPRTCITGSDLTSLLRPHVLRPRPPRTALSPLRSLSSLTHCRTPPTAHPPRLYLVGTHTSVTVSQPEVPIRSTPTSPAE